jgi:hypothetical protein
MLACAAFKTEMVFSPSIAKYDQVFADVLSFNSRKYWEQNSENYYAPYMALFQSSMMGKSRLLKEQAQEKFFAVLICLRKKSFEFEPPRTAHVADVLLSDDTASSQDLMTFLLKSYVKAFLEWLREFPHDKRQQLSPKDWQNHQPKADIQVGNELRRAIKDSRFEVALDDWESLSQSYPFLDNTSGLDILFVFDEARELLVERKGDKLNLFRYIQKSHEFTGFA